MKMREKIVYVAPEVDIHNQYHNEVDWVIQEGHRLADKLIHPRLCIRSRIFNSLSEAEDFLEELVIKKHSQQCNNNFFKED